jgi:preprotein translocase SecE subunit
MTVAVKNTPESQTSSPFDRLPVASLVGVVYVLAGIAIIVKGLPALVWTWLGLSQQSFPAWFLLIVCILAAVAGLAYVGSRLAGPTPPRGLRAGIFVALIGIGIIAMITRWASTLFERLSFDNHWFSAEVGLGLTAAVGLILLVIAGRFFFRPGFEAFLRKFEDQGWFSAAAYKPKQGLLVRRGTTVGLLVLAGCGIWVYGQRLSAGASDWVIELPFTGLVSVRDPGDIDRADPPIDVNFRDQVVILDAGDWPDFKAEQFVGREDFDAVVKQLKGAVKVRAGDAGRFEDEDFVKDRDTLIVNGDAFKRLQRKLGLQPNTVKLPKAARVLDRYEMQRANDALQRDYVKVTKASRFQKKDFSAGDVVAKEKFDEVYKKQSKQADDLEAKAERLKATNDDYRGEEEKAKELRDLLPASAEPDSMEGDTRHESMTLLPHVRFVLPLLLLAGAIWLSWRIVNLPTFADFLIATEAELNKVSWTTRHRLVQDTIVVLTATLLITLFLLFSDVVWSWLLQRVGVLRTPDKDAASQVQDEAPW